MELQCQQGGDDKKEEDTQKVHGTSSTTASSSSFLTILDKPSHVTCHRHDQRTVHCSSSRNDVSQQQQQQQERRNGGLLLACGTKQEQRRNSMTLVVQSLLLGDRNDDDNDVSHLCKKQQQLQQQRHVISMGLNVAQYCVPAGMLGLQDMVTMQSNNAKSCRQGQLLTWTRRMTTQQQQREEQKEPSSSNMMTTAGTMQKTCSQLLICGGHDETQHSNHHHNKCTILHDDGVASLSSPHNKEASLPLLLPKEVVENTSPECFWQPSSSSLRQEQSGFFGGASSEFEFDVALMVHLAQQHVMIDNFGPRNHVQLGGKL